MVDLQQPSSSAPCRETACGWHPLAARLHRTGPCTLELGRERSRGARRSGDAYRLVGILRVLIERIDVRPADDGSTIEFVGEIANMATLSALGRASPCSYRRSVSWLGEPQPALFAHISGLDPCPKADATADSLRLRWRYRFKLGPQPSFGGHYALGSLA